MRAALQTTPLIDYIPQRAAKPIFLSLVELVVTPPPQPTTVYFTEIDFLAQTAAAAVFDLFSMRC